MTVTVLCLLTMTLVMMEEGAAQGTSPDVQVADITVASSALSETPHVHVQVQDSGKPTDETKVTNRHQLLTGPQSSQNLEGPWGERSGSSTGEFDGGFQGHEEGLYPHQNGPVDTEGFRQHQDNPQDQEPPSHGRKPSAQEGRAFPHQEKLSGGSAAGDVSSSGLRGPWGPVRLQLDNMYGNHQGRPTPEPPRRPLMSTPDPGEPKAGQYQTQNTDEKLHEGLPTPGSTPFFQVTEHLPPTAEPPAVSRSSQIRAKNSSQSSEENRRDDTGNSAENPKELPPQMSVFRRDPVTLDPASQRTFRLKTVRDDSKELESLDVLPPNRPDPASGVETESADKPKPESPLAAERHQREDRPKSDDKVMENRSDLNDNPATINRKLVDREGSRNKPLHKTRKSTANVSPRTFADLKSYSSLDSHRRLQEDYDPALPESYPLANENNRPDHPNFRGNIQIEGDSPRFDAKTRKEHEREDGHRHVYPTPREIPPQNSNESPYSLHEIPNGQGIYQPELEPSNNRVYRRKEAAESYHQHETPPQHDIEQGLYNSSADLQAKQYPHTLQYLDLRTAPRMRGGLPTVIYSSSPNSRELRKSYEGYGFPDTIPQGKDQSLADQSYTQDQRIRGTRLQQHSAQHIDNSQIYQPALPRSQYKPYETESGSYNEAKHDSGKQPSHDSNREGFREHSAQGSDRLGFKHQSSYENNGQGLRGHSSYGNDRQSVNDQSSYGNDGQDFRGQSLYGNDRQGPRGQSSYDGLGSRRQSSYDGLGSRRQSSYDGLGSRRQSSYDGLGSRRQSSYDGLGPRRQSSYNGLGSRRQSSYDGLDSRRQSSYDGLGSRRQSSYDGLGSRRQSSYGNNRDSFRGPPFQEAIRGGLRSQSPRDNGGQRFRGHPVHYNDTGSVGGQSLDNDTGFRGQTSPPDHHDRQYPYPSDHEKSLPRPLRYNDEQHNSDFRSSSPDLHHKHQTGHVESPDGQGKDKKELAYRQHDEESGGGNRRVSPFERRPYSDRHDSYPAPPEHRTVDQGYDTRGHDTRPDKPIYLPGKFQRRKSPQPGPFPSASRPQYVFRHPADFHGSNKDKFDDNTPPRFGYGRHRKRLPSDIRFHDRTSDLSPHHFPSTDGHEQLDHDLTSRSGSFEAPESHRQTSSKYFRPKFSVYGTSLPFYSGTPRFHSKSKNDLHDRHGHNEVDSENSFSKHGPSGLRRSHDHFNDDYFPRLRRPVHSGHSSDNGTHPESTPYKAHIEKRAYDRRNPYSSRKEQVYRELLQSIPTVPYDPRSKKTTGSRLHRNSGSQKFDEQNNSPYTHGGHSSKQSTRYHSIQFQADKYNSHQYNPSGYYPDQSDSSHPGSSHYGSTRYTDEHYSASHDNDHNNHNTAGYQESVPYSASDHNQYGNIYRSQDSHSRTEDGYGQGLSRHSSSYVTPSKLSASQSPVHQRRTRKVVKQEAFYVPYTNDYNSILKQIRSGRYGDIGGKTSSLQQSVSDKDLGGHRGHVSNQNAVSPQYYQDSHNRYSSSNSYGSSGSTSPQTDYGFSGRYYSPGNKDYDNSYGSLHNNRPVYSTPKENVSPGYSSATKYSSSTNHDFAEHSHHNDYDHVNNNNDYPYVYHASQRYSSPSSPAHNESPYSRGPVGNDGYPHLTQSSHGDTLGHEGSAHSYGPSGSAHSYGPSGSAHSYGPSESAHSYGPSDSYGSSESAHSYGPSGPAHSYGPSGSANTYGPSGPANSYEPSGSAHSYGPSDSYGSVDSHGPSNSYGSIDNYGPSGSANSYGPSRSTNSYGPSRSANSYGPSDSYGSVDSYGPSGSAHSNGPSGSAHSYGPSGSAHSYGPSGSAHSYGPSGSAHSYGPSGSAHSYGPSNSYGSVDSYGHSNSYGSADSHGPSEATESYGHSNSYGSADSYGHSNSYGSADSHGHSNSYGVGRSANSYGPSNSYGPTYSYRPSNSHGPSSDYGSPFSDRSNSHRSPNSANAQGYREGDRILKNYGSGSRHGYPETYQTSLSTHRPSKNYGPPNTYRNSPSAYGFPADYGSAMAPGYKESRGMVEDRRTSYPPVRKPHLPHRSAVYRTGFPPRSEKIQTNKEVGVTVVRGHKDPINDPVLTLEEMQKMLRHRNQQQLSFLPLPVASVTSGMHASTSLPVRQQNPQSSRS